MTRSIQTVEDLLVMLDALFAPEADRWTGRGASWWDDFYAERDRPVPFFQPAPDEGLVAWHADGKIEKASGARALDLGCGPGRNAVWLAQQGYQVEAVDLSLAALAWGRERAAAAGVRVDFHQADILSWSSAEPYDLVVDSGCFHHLPPHRRISYRQMLERVLAAGGCLALSAFASGRMGSEAPDETFYRDGRLAGGIAYSAEDLRASFGWLTELELRAMRELPDDAPAFGKDFLWVGLFRRAMINAEEPALRPAHERG